MFSMKPPLLLGTGDCGLASLLAGLYWGRCEGGAEEVPGGGPSTNALWAWMVVFSKSVVLTLRR